MPVSKESFKAFQGNFRHGLGSADYSKDDEEGEGKAAKDLNPSAAPSAKASLGVDDEEDEKKPKKSWE